MRIIFLGMGGILSLAPLATVLEAGHDVVAVITPAPEGRAAWRPLPPAATASELPVTTPFVERNIVHLAWERQIAVFAAGDLNDPVGQREWRRLQPDLVCVSCFPRRIPRSLLALPRHGFLNLHPSLLPAYRGPHPLFWQLRDGLRQGGVTVHLMSEALDAGDIVLQAPLSWPDGISGAELEQRAGELGGELFVEALQRLQEGQLPRRPQPDGGSYQPPPQAADFQLDAAWSARRAFNFMRGTAHWGLPYPITLGGQRLRLRQAVTYDARRRLPEPLVSEPPHVLVQFRQGILRASLVA